MKIRTKIPKLQMHENLHKNVNVHIFMQIFMSSYDGQLKQQICYSYSFTQLIFIWFLNHLKWQFSSCFFSPKFQIQQAPGDNFIKAGKSMKYLAFYRLTSRCNIYSLLDLYGDIFLGRQIVKTCQALHRLEKYLNLEGFHE